MQFPNLPINNQVYVLNNNTYTFNSDLKIWFVEGTSPTNIPIPEYTYAELRGVRHTVLSNNKDDNNLWNNIRTIREQRIIEIEWRYNRYARLARLGLTQIDDLTKLDNYTQALADITNQENPSAIVWPVITDYIQI